MIEKGLPPVFELEFMTVYNLGTELGMCNRELLALLKKEGFLLQNNKPSEFMLQAGYMVYNLSIVGKKMKYDPVFTSSGYFFLKGNSKFKRKRVRIYLNKKIYEKIN